MASKSDWVEGDTGLPNQGDPPPSPSACEKQRFTDQVDRSTTITSEIPQTENC